MKKELKKALAQRVLKELFDEGADVESALQRATKGVPFRKGHTEEEQEEAREIVFELLINIKARRLK